MMLKCILYLWFLLLVENAFPDSDFVVLNETEFTPIEYVRTTYLKAPRFNLGFNDPFADEYFQDEEAILTVISTDTLIEYLKESVQTLQSLLLNLKKLMTEMEKLSASERNRTIALEEPIANKSETFYNREYSSSPITADFYDIDLNEMDLFKIYLTIMEQSRYTPDVLTVSGKHSLQIDGKPFAGSFSYDIFGVVFSIRQSELLNRLSYLFKIEESLRYDKISDGNVTFSSGAETKDDLLMRKLHLEAFTKSNLLLTSLSKITGLNKIRFAKQFGFRNWYMKLIKAYQMKIIPNSVNLLKLYLKKMAIEKNNSTIVTSDISGKPITFINIDKFRLEAPAVTRWMSPFADIIMRGKATYNDSKAIIHYEAETYQVNSITLVFKAKLTSTGDINVDFSDADLSYIRPYDFHLVDFEPINFATNVDQSTADTLNLFVKQVSLKFIREALKK